jgi:hypothetical protein
MFGLDVVAEVVQPEPCLTFSRGQLVADVVGVGKAYEWVGVGMLIMAAGRQDKVGCRDEVEIFWAPPTRRRR